VSPRLLALLGAALIVRLVFFGGLLGWDDVEYWEAARALRAGRFVPASTFELRYTLTVPLALGQAWLGEREWVPALVPLAYSVAHLLLAWALARPWGGTRVATAAVALLAVLPLDVIGATDVHADLPLAVFLAATVYAVLRGERAPRAQRAWFLLAGATLALGTMTKETALALLVVLALRRKLTPGGASLAAYGCLAVGLVGVLAADMIWLGCVTGHPLYRYAGPTPGFHRALMLDLPSGYGWMLGYPAMLLSPLNGSFGYFAGIFYLVVATTLRSLREPAPVAAQLALWWGVLLAFFNFAPLDASFTRPLFHHFARTLHPLLLPFVVAAALWLVEGSVGRRFVRTCAVVAFAALAAVGIVVTHADYRAWAAIARQAAPVVASLPADSRVVTDPMTASQLRFLLPSRRERITSDPNGGAAPAPGPVFVLLDPLYLGRARRSVPEGMTPSSSWRRVAHFDRRPRTSLRGALDRLLARTLPPSADTGGATLWRAGP